jgi:hypothetical protein
LIPRQATQVLRLFRGTGLAVALLLLIGCGSDRVRVSSVSGTNNSTRPEQRLAPEDLPPALQALCQRVVLEVTAACERIDAASRSNAVRRKTLLWRIRATEVSAEAENRDNHAIGMIELWFWTASMAAYFREGGNGADAFGEAQGEAAACVDKLALECESLVQRTVPEKGFAQLRERVMISAGKGELFTASAEQSRDMLKSMMDVTHLEGLLSLPLAPFTALKGIGKGSDAVAELVVVAQQAVNLAQRYPQLLTWNAQLAVLAVEDQETVRGMREDMRRLVDIAEQLPNKIRVEGAALLGDDATRDTLKQTESTAIALTKLADSVNALLARIQTMNAQGPGDSTQSQGRIFDIREYEATLRAAESTARETQEVILAATGAMGKPQVVTAANATADRLEEATSRLFIWTMVALIALGAVVAGLITMHHMMDMNKIRKTQRFENTALMPKKPKSENKSS